MSRLEFVISANDEFIRVDGEEIYWHCLDYWDLVRSVQKDDDYFFFTCGCGVPECADIYEPVKKTSDENKVYWHIEEPGPESWYTFTKSDYGKSIKKGLEDILRFHTRPGEMPMVGPYGFERETCKNLLKELTAYMDVHPEIYG